MITEKKLGDFVRKWNAGELETIPDADGYFQDLIGTVRALWKENAGLRLLLAKERDDFGRKETELAKENQELWRDIAKIAKLEAVVVAAENHGSLHELPEFCHLCEALAALKRDK